MVKWVGTQKAHLAGVRIVSTGTTGSHIKDAYSDLEVTCLKSGPLGGDQQIGAMICEEKLDALIFFVDPLSPMPHDVDVKALTRIATLEQVVMACNAASADFVIASDMIDKEYSPRDDEAAHAR